MPSFVDGGGPQDIFVPSQKKGFSEVYLQKGGDACH